MDLPGGITATEFGAIIAALVILGGLLKHAFTELPNRFIPLILLALGTTAVLVSADEITGSTVVAAIVTVATAIGSHQLVKTTSGKDV